MSSADASAAMERVAGLWGPPALFEVLLQHVRAGGTVGPPAVRAWSLKVPHAMGHPCAAGPPGKRQPRGGRSGCGGCDHICGDTCADYGKWVNLPAAGGGLAGGGSWQGPARGRVRPLWPPLSPLSPGCQAVTRDMARGRGSGTRQPACPQPARARRGGSRWLRHGAVWSPQVHQVSASEPAQAGGTVPPKSRCPGVSHGRLPAGSPRAVSRAAPCQLHLSAGCR